MTIKNLKIKYPKETLTRNSREGISGRVVCVR